MSESVENLEKENKLKSLLKGNKDSGNRKYSEESSNSRSFSQSQKRTPEYGQNFWGYQSRPQKTNKNFQNHQGRKHSSYQTRRWTWIIYYVYDFVFLKQFLEVKVKQFKAGSIRSCFEKWKLITSAQKCYKRSGACESIRFETSTYSRFSIPIKTKWNNFH